jgi:TonB-linked SusC/RagA family outer membrane protein
MQLPANGKILPFMSPKSLLIMKLTAWLLLITCLQVYSKSNAQITLTMKKATLEEVLQQIRQQSGYNMVYDVSMVRQKSHEVNIKLVNIPVTSALEQVLADQPLTFNLAGGNSIYIVERALMAPQDSTVRGIVTGNDLVPLPGATIKIKNTKLGTSTDVQGAFSFKSIPSEAVLEVSFIGYETLLQTYNGQNFLNIHLKPATSKLDEVQVMGYGTTTQRFSTGSISTISSKEIAQQPVTNPLQALSGRLPGILITEQSGTPGAGISVQIRGIGSLLSGTAPLYIIDGAPFTSEAVYTAGGNTNGYLQPSFGSSPLNNINPADIESIDVLKDADATAIYGSRGSNGVVLITTKRGKPGKTNVDITASTGSTRVADIHAVKPLSLQQYLEVRRTAFANSNATPTVNNAPDLKVWDTTKSTDFQKLMIGKAAITHDANISFSGGSQQTNFLLSGTYHRETAVIPGDYNYQRGAIHFTAEHTSPDRKFNATISSTMSWDKNNNVDRLGYSYDLALVGLTKAPDFPLYNNNGGLYWMNSFSLNYDNPLGYTYAPYTMKNNNLIGNISLRYTPIKGLNIKVSSSYNKLLSNSQKLSYSKSINPYQNTLPSAYFMENVLEGWNVEPQADYTRAISRGILNVLAGTTFQSNSFNQPYYLVATNYTSDALLTSPSAAGSLRVYTFSSQYKYQSVFGRMNYKWDDKYILNANYRWDASSKFGINNRYGSFASAGAAWIFSQEAFMQSLSQVISFGKLRASYGTSGNDQISNYQYMDTYSTSYYGYNGVGAIIPSRIANPDLKWEVSKKREVGLELGFLKDRILLTGAWFLNKTNNPLVQGPLSTVTGFPTSFMNLPATLKQQGMEYSINAQPVKRKNFSWSTTFNITFADTKLASFPSIQGTSYAYTNVVGKSMSGLYGYQFMGIDPTSHLPYFLDANKNGTTSFTTETGLMANGLGDYVYFGKSNPDFFGGFSNSFRYKAFQLDVFIQFTGRNLKKNAQSLTNVPGYNPVNMTQSTYRLFKETNGKIATRTFSYSENTPYLSAIKYGLSDAVYSNAAYARLKNVSLVYNFDSKWVSKVKLTAAQIYVRAQNLLTLTHFDGYDPETGAAGIPPLRTITGGFKLTF